MGKSFRCGFDGISKQIITDVEISDIHNNNKIKVEALWDTGSNVTIIRNDVAGRLGIKPVGSGYMDTISDKKVASDVYKINLFLTYHIEILKIKVVTGEPKSCDMLIGMDIISQGDFAISNHNGKTTFIFRIPSMGEFSYEPTVSNIHVNRNDLCPCKSGKKYKQCCLNK